MTNWTIIDDYTFYNMNKNALRIYVGADQSLISQNSRKQ